MAEALFASGVLTTATRVGFARHYDLVERVLPPDVLARQVDDDEAVRELTLRAATALGVGTEADIRDYFRLSAQQVKPAIADLVAAGEIERVDVDGWSAPAYLRAGRTVPRLDRGTALLCPFDPLIFFRPRVERLFNFHYRIEIYTPARQAPVRLLRVAVAAGRSAGRAGRPQGRPRRRHAAGGGRVRRARYAAHPGRRGAGRRAGVDGLRGWAWAGSACPAGATWPATCARPAKRAAD